MKTWHSMRGVVGRGRRRAAACGWSSLAMAAAVLAGFAAGPAGAGDVPVLPPAPELSPIGCGPKAGSCFQSRKTPGCEWGPCCAAVCSMMPECCTSAWDDLCVELADRLCEQPSACEVSLNDCDTPGRRPGCRDETCCEFVCSIDPYCCTSRWDDLCVAASRDCGADSCFVVAVDALAEGEDCEMSVNNGCDQVSGFATTPLPLGATLAGRTWARGSRDVDWYRVELDTTEAIRIEVEAEFPVEVTVMDGDCEGGFSARAVEYFGACTPGEVLLVLPAGVHHVVIAAGLDGRPLPTGIPCITDALPYPRTYNNGYVLRVSPIIGG